MHLPELDAVAIISALERDAVGARVLVLSGDVDSDTVYRAVGAGARGYLPKESARDAICDAIVAVARGEVVLAANVQAGLAMQLRARAADEHALLTGREREVLVLTAAGDNAAEVAAKLNVSPATVKTHLQNVYEKLGVSDRAAAVATAMRRGILE
jgi:two-component system nitrate/nitrite response regulator NarL